MPSLALLMLLSKAMGKSLMSRMAFTPPPANSFTLISHSMNRNGKLEQILNDFIMQNQN